MDGRRIRNLQIRNLQIRNLQKRNLQIRNLLIRNGDKFVTKELLIFDIQIVYTLCKIRKYFIL